MSKNNETKQKNLKDLETLILDLKETGEEITISKLAEYAGKSRQYFYGKHVKSLLEQHKIGQQYKEKKVASSEYLLERINKNLETMEKLNSKIDKLKIRELELSQENKSLCENLAKQEKRFKTFLIRYYNLITDYNKIARTPLSSEPFDINNDITDLILEQIDEEKLRKKLGIISILPK
jgi:uncharacterized protein (DUF342 family)